MMCHGELARRKPAPRYLTLFYLMVSLGGALGGIFVALIAPRVFHDYLELQTGIVACAVLAMIVLWNVKVPKSAHGLSGPRWSSVSECWRDIWFEPSVKKPRATC